MKTLVRTSDRTTQIIHDRKSKLLRWSTTWSISQPHERLQSQGIDPIPHQFSRLQSIPSLIVALISHLEGSIPWLKPCMWLGQLLACSLDISHGYGSIRWWKPCMHMAGLYIMVCFIWAVRSVVQWVTWVVRSDVRIKVFYIYILSRSSPTYGGVNWVT